MKRALAIAAHRGNERSNGPPRWSYTMSAPERTMFLHRLAGGLVFLAGVGLSRLGVVLHLWPLMALGLIALCTGLWHFLVAGTAQDVAHGHRVPRAEADLDDVP